jgi:2-polyprenyl-6-methoxyphenol hydroxylase-like FAD-dependent oxidoreductase
MKTKMADHAVVIGGSMAGLLAARALADTHEHVTIVERDRLPAVGEGRKAVPQGRHVHLLLPAGLQAIESLLPGVQQELVDAGAHPFPPGELRFEIRGHVLTRDGDPELCVSASRPLVEGVVRRRVLELPNVEITENTEVTGLTADDGGRRVTGARLRERGGDGVERPLHAQRVVAATGRAGQGPAWLEALGYARPLEETLRIELSYATRSLRRDPASLGGDKWVLVGPRPGWPRGLALSAVEGDRWLLTLAGYGSAHHPPTDEAGFMEFVASVAPPEILTTIEEAEPLGDIVPHGFPTNQRRRYERLAAWPDGFLVCGDAIASFNPLYGQGMTVAALEACALRDCLRQGPDGLERRFLRAAMRHVEHAWQMAVGGDLALPEVDGHRPLPVRVLNAYTDRLLRVARHDASVASAFRSVVGMLQSPPHLMRPDVALRVLRG